MVTNLSGWLRTLSSATGFALAGPGGALVGHLAGGLLATLLPGTSGFMGEVISRFSTKAIELSGTALAERLTSKEKQRINHDLQAAFRDAFTQALYDLGGVRCFPAHWAPKKRDVPSGAVYPSTPQGDLLWRGGNPLAEQVCDCLQKMERAVVEGRLLPLDPPRDQPAAGVQRYLEAETFESLNTAFFDDVLSPYLAAFSSLIREIPDFEAHLRRNLLDRTLVHLGELLKARTPAWRAYNRMILETLRSEVRQVESGQSEIADRLDTLLDRSNPARMEQLATGMADLLSATGQLEKQVDEGFDSMLARLAQQHQELLARFNVLIATSGRIESKVDRVLRMLEDGRYVIEGTPSVSIDAPPAPGEPPFKGLQFFDEPDADLFFGRELLTAKLVARIGEILSLPPAEADQVGLQFLAVVGASGSGKSSLVRAGLIPAIKKGRPLGDGTLPPPDSPRWPIYLITPTAHPLQALAASLASITNPPSAANLAENFAADPQFLGLHARQILSQWRATGGDRLLLVVDQFEELFTLCRSAAERKAFVDNLLAAAEADGPLVLVITLRADFYAHCAQFDDLRTALETHQAYIGPMSEAELRSAIQGPAQSGGLDGIRWEFERGLVDLFVRDVGDEPGALPLLSHALLETWKHRRGHTMTLESYAESGGVRGAIAKTAETVYFQRLTPDQRLLARKIFLSLTEPGEETGQGLPAPDTRRRVRLADLIPDPKEQPAANAATQAVLQVLADARLVTIGEETAEVAHEALIREWPTLRRWLDEDRAGLRLHRQLSDAAREWASLRQETAVLYRGSRLTQAIEYAEAHPDQISSLERNFLNTSKLLADRLAAEKDAARQRELQAAQQLAQEAEARRQAEADRARLAEQASNQLRNRNRIITGVGALAALAAVFACLLAGTSFYFGLQSNKNASQAEANLGTAQAANTQVVAEANTRATAEADAIRQEATAEAASAEAQLQSQISLARELAARSTGVLERDTDLGLLLAIESVEVANSLDGTVVQEAQTALYHALDTAKYQRVLRGHGNDAWLALFSPDGEQILTSSEDGTARLWDTEGRLITTFEIDPAKIVFANFSPDGSQIVTGSDDGIVRQWRLDGTLIRTLEGHTKTVYTAIYSPDGKLIVTAGADNTARLWRADGSFIKSLEGHSNEVTAAGFSPDGKKILTTSYDNTLRLYQSDGTFITALEGHTGWPISFSFNPDSTRIVSAGWDGTARLWSAEGEPLAILEGHTRSVNSAVFSPDGGRILTASTDTTARLWSADGEPIATLEGHTGPVNLAVFSPDGSRILTASHDITLRLWTAEGTFITSLLGHLDFVNWGIFSPDGSRIVTASDDDTVRLWRFDRLYRQVLIGHVTTVSSAEFSPDGATIVTGSADSTARFWHTDGTFIDSVEGKAGPVYSVDFSPDGRRVILGCYNNVAQIFRTDGTLLKTLEGHQNWVSWASFSPDGSRIVTASWDGTARLWRADGAFLTALEGHSDYVHMAKFSPDGTLIVTASADATAKLWREDGTLVTTLEGHQAPVLSAVFSPDGSLILTASYDGTARLWRADGTPLSTFKGQTAQLSSADFSPDGSMIVTTSLDGTAWLWKSDGTFISSLEGHRTWVNSGSFSPDGLRLITTSWDGTARLWGVYGDVEAMLTEARLRVGRELTDLECQQYLHQEACSP